MFTCEHNKDSANSGYCTNWATRRSKAAHSENKNLIASVVPNPTLELCQAAPAHTPLRPPIAGLSQYLEPLSQYCWIVEPDRPL
jgi:hypothetical protein